MILPREADLSLAVGEPVEDVEGGEGQGEQQSGQAVYPKQKEEDLGLKCSAWKVFGSKDFCSVGL